MAGGVLSISSLYPQEPARNLTQCLADVCWAGGEEGGNRQETREGESRKRKFEKTEGVQRREKEDEIKKKG